MYVYMRLCACASRATATRPPRSMRSTHPTCSPVPFVVLPMLPMLHVLRVLHVCLCGFVPWCMLFLFSSSFVILDVLLVFLFVVCLCMSVHVCACLCMSVCDCVCSLVMRMRVASRCLSSLQAAGVRSMGTGPRLNSAMFLSRESANGRPISNSKSMPSSAATARAAAAAIAAAQAAGGWYQCRSWWHGRWLPSATKRKGGSDG